MGGAFYLVLAPEAAADVRTACKEMQTEIDK